MNAGNIRAGCNAFAGWIVRSDGQVRAGLVARRGGDGRKGEKQLCLEGLTELKAPAPPDWKCNGPPTTRAASCDGAAPVAPAPKRHWWSWMFK